MKHTLRITGTLLLGVFLFASCSDMSMFTPSPQETVSIDVVSMKEGAFLSSGDSIGFLIRTEDQSLVPEYLDISLLDQSGQSVWNTSVSSPLTDEQLQLLLPDLESGQYTVVFSVIAEEGTTEEQRISFFYTSGKYEIRGISSFPPTTMAGHQTVLQADLLYPAQSDPFIRWSQDELILAKGLVSEGLQSIAWPAPEEEGVYAIRVEMFPVPPPSGGDYTFSSSLELTAKLFVQAANILTEDELVPEDSYYSLFHLNGSLRDSGTLGEKDEKNEARPLGQSRWSSASGTMGFLTGGGSGLLYARSVLPILDGELSPCTLTFKLRAAGENADQNLLVVRNAEAPLFRIFFDGDQQLVATLEAGETTITLPSAIFGLKANQHHRLDLSLVPGARGLQALWFLDGHQTAVVSTEVLPAALPQDGQTTIGGEKGFNGTITEFGVYYRDARGRAAVDPAIFAQVMQQRHGRRLILAEGFEGLYLPDPDSWTLNAPESAALSGGRLQLPASSELTLPYFELREGETEFLIDFYGSVPRGSTVSLTWEGQEQPFLTADPTGTVRSEALQEQYTPTDSSFRLTLSRGSVVLQTAAEAKEFPLQPPDDPNPWLSVILSSPVQDGVLEVDSILIVEEQRPSP